MWIDHMKIEHSEVLFESTGRKEYANGGIIGISGDMAYHGYDSEFVDAIDLTDDERTELAQFMIEQWNQFLGVAKKVKNGINNDRC